MTDIALVLEHSSEADVSQAFAWNFRTDIAQWNDPPATFLLDGPFADGLGVQLCYRGKSPWPGGFATFRLDGRSRSKCRWIEQHSDSNGILAPSPSAGLS